jgi:hypothetical protein
VVYTKNLSAKIENISEIGEVRVRFNASMWTDRWKNYTTERMLEEIIGKNNSSDNSTFEIDPHRLIDLYVEPAL